MNHKEHLRNDSIFTILYIVRTWEKFKSSIPSAKVFLNKLFTVLFSFKTPNSKSRSISISSLNLQAISAVYWFLWLKIQSIWTRPYKLILRKSNKRFLKSILKRLLFFSSSNLLNFSSNIYFSIIKHLLCIHQSYIYIIKTFIIW